MNDLAGNVRAAREAKGYTQARLGLAAGVSRNAITSLENGYVTNPGVYTLHHIAIALTTPLETLMGVAPIMSRDRVHRSENSRLHAKLGAVRTLAEALADDANPTVMGIGAAIIAVLDGNGR